jgi:hypothetical protein
LPEQICTTFSAAPALIPRFPGAGPLAVWQSGADLPGIRLVWGTGKPE